MDVFVISVDPTTKSDKVLPMETQLAWEIGFVLSVFGVYPIAFKNRI